MTPSRRRITILGSTGSIGESALAVVRRFPEHFEVVGLSAQHNVARLTEQVHAFQPVRAVVGAPGAVAGLVSAAPATRVESGADGLASLAAEPVDVVLNAVVGAAGLAPALAAVRAGNTLAMANKEPFVMAGRLLMEEAAAHGATILPVDSEHSAIFQCLAGQRRADLYKVHLTASGGPFYRRDPQTLADITPAEATRHPTWDMGTKISVDSATLMNKGLEIIEAMWLFGLAVDDIEVVIHPQSIIHSLVEFRDGQLLAHLGVTDMRFPILYALSYPERLGPPMERLDLTQLSALTFDRPDFAAFPCLAYAREAAERGGTAPAVLNAANEEAVAAFCAGGLAFPGIAQVVRRVLDTVPVSAEYSLDAVRRADRAARDAAREWTHSKELR